MPTAVLRRYTPPTCTLEIAATRSPLSRWTPQTVVKDLNFRLSFDDPKLAAEQQVVVSGNQQQLEALWEVVSAYVQQLLLGTPDQIPWEPSLQNKSHPPQLAVLPLKPGLADLSLQPQGLLSHRLHLGSLATAESGQTIDLTALQLFDLANALEDYHSEALSLPSLSRPAWLPQRVDGWGRIAAIALVAFGVTGAMAKFVLDIATPTVQTASAPSERQVNSELSTELFPTLSPPPVEPSPTVTLQPLPPLPPTGAAASNNSGLPPVGVTQAPAPQPAATELPAPTIASGSTAASGSPGPVTVIPAPADGTIATAPAESLAQANRSATPPRLTGVESTDSMATADALAPRAALNAAPSNTAFDTIPQVAEVRTYFQQNWQPPAELQETLEYRLLLSADGSLQRIVPLGRAAEQYIDRTDMPLMGEPFVSPTGDGSTPQIRLVLKTDGKVQSFLEYAN